ncbi:helix-turn-helix transcriptional regulator [Paeniglutamicibacter psychrophenolicus]|uniref:Transcriptional regulator with XRE-family HTH domain n=1 Tax=Paeniglutamicibacter psychrophenolicus TaxID=257454 RepID=A0ABS4WIP7_9MICC|nr:helix-turn-helix transcriptional regulator [Paeniglutamicibacter psychrophenolicus]MBP2376084.1 transcriptional regulator with XRE-family HTH domain [Paeniglutamicibacter psychrophenolicus]
MSVERRRELGQFLRDRRGNLVRAELGLPPIGRNRTLGLRREEIAAFAAVSVTWYTWLEQGRDINASRQVLESIARVLTLTAAETAYLLAMGGYTPVPSAEVMAIEQAPDHLQRLLDAFDFPAFAVAPDWGIAGWNRAYAGLYTRIAAVDPEDRNLLWLIFTDPHLRQMLPDWEETSRHFVAEFRAEAGARLGSAAHTTLLKRLGEASGQFAKLWADRGVERFASRQRVFMHPVAGELVFEQHRLVPSDAPELHLVMYVPVPGTPTAERIRKLLADETA